MSLPLGVSLPSDAFAWPTIDLHIETAIELIHQQQKHGCKYGLGAKIHPLTLDPGQYSAVDCSGEARYLIYRSTMPRCTIPDGSWIQAEWFRTHGFKQSDFASGTLKDGKVRIAFLNPQKSKSGIGHVALIHQGFTLEAHSSKGPNRREFESQSWGPLCEVFVVCV